MGVGQTALARRIEREDQEAAQAERDRRLAIARGGVTRRRSKWALDHLLDTGQITPGQHDAAERLAAAIVTAYTPPHLAGSAPTQVHPGWDLTFAAEMDRVARGWKHEQSRQAAAGARSWIAAAPLTTKARMRLYDRLFALPAPSMKAMRGANGGSYERDSLVPRISAMLEVLCAYWDAMDRGYGPQEPEGRFGR